MKPQRSQPEDSPPEGSRSRRSPPLRSPSTRGPAARDSTEGSKAARRPPQRDLSERDLAARGPSERGPSERSTSERGLSERGRLERGPSPRSAPGSGESQRPARASAPGAARVAYHHGNLYAAALERAAQRVADGGTGALSLRALARDLGVSPAALYRHFADKDDLLAALAQRASAALDAALRESLAAESGTDPAQRLAALGRGYLRFARVHPDAFRLVFELKRDTAPGADGPGPFALLVAAVRALAPPGADDGRVLRATLGAWAFVHGLAGLESQHAWRGDIASVADALLRDYARAVQHSYPA